MATDSTPSAALEHRLIVRTLPYMTTWTTTKISTYATDQDGQGILLLNKRQIYSAIENSKQRTNDLDSRFLALCKALAEEGLTAVPAGEKPCAGAAYSIITLRDRYRVNFRCGYGRHNYAPCVEITRPIVGRGDWPFTSVAAPAGCPPYFTRGRRYEVVRFQTTLDGEALTFHPSLGYGFYLKTDTGAEVFCNEKQCAHLAGSDWQR